ncbi:MAG: hypothetical protein HWE09_01105 [Cyclobacteriaceae bacterium]|nr:hypothetical protein [Cyclobacteriaceae bacterium]
MLSSAQEMIEAGIVDAKLVKRMESDLDLLAEDPDGVFFYQFIQAKAYKP